jgi:hypothetical protein
MTDTELLPPMHTIGSLRISRAELKGHPAYGALLRQAATSGACPVWISEPEYLRPPDTTAAALRRIDTADPVAILERQWTPDCPLCACRDPFGSGFPGLAPPGAGHDDIRELALEQAADAESLHTGRLAVVPVPRPADVVTAIGWTGPCNYGRDLADLSAVLRSWEERFGAVVVRIGRATLWLSVAAPPRSARHAQEVAAEHFAFCRDVDWEDPRPLRTYASGLIGRSTWRFWWD